MGHIARDGHVYSLLANGRMFAKDRWEPEGRPNRVGIREASTFAGFCAHHDDELFAPIEKEPFKGSRDQIALLGYRAICHELFVKQRSLLISEQQREFDKGTPPAVQHRYQGNIDIFQRGAGMAVQELGVLKGQYEATLFGECSQELDHFVVEFAEVPEVVCSATSQSTHDFRGNRVDMLSLRDFPSHWLTFSLIATDKGGAAIFSWLPNHHKTLDVVRTLHEMTDVEIPHAIVRFTFEFFENTYLSPGWWDGLNSHVRTSLKVRQLRDVVGIVELPSFTRPDDCLLDDGIRAVNWSVTSRAASWD